jgi:hypothetical protein
MVLPSGSIVISDGVAVSPVGTTSLTGSRPSPMKIRAFSFGMGRVGFHPDHDNTEAKKKTMLDNPNFPHIGIDFT